MLPRVEDAEIGRGAAGAAVISSASVPAAPCGASQRRSSSGSRTVAERPVAVSPGASLRSRARPRLNRSPRFEPAISVNSSKTTRRSEANRVRRRRSQAAARAARASSAGYRAARGAGAGASRRRCRRCGSRCGCASPISATGISSCARRRPPAPSAAKCRAYAARAAFCGVREIDEAGQKAGQRLAGAGRRDQQRVLRCARAQQRELMRARRPAPRGEPGGKARREFEIRNGQTGLPRLNIARI